MPMPGRQDKVTLNASADIFARRSKLQTSATRCKEYKLESLRLYRPAWQPWSSEPIALPMLASKTTIATITNIHVMNQTGLTWSQSLSLCKSGILYRLQRDIWTGSGKIVLMYVPMAVHTGTYWYVLIHVSTKNSL
jgi:hypothetical protein